MTSLPVPARRPWFKSRARLVLVPGLSLSYQLRISRTRSVMCRATAWRSSVRVCIIAMDGLPLEFLHNLSYHAVLFSGMAGATCASGSVCKRLQQLNSVAERIVHVDPVVAFQSFIRFRAVTCSFKELFEVGEALHQECWMCFAGCPLLVLQLSSNF